MRRSKKRQLRVARRTRYRMYKVEQVLGASATAGDGDLSYVWKKMAREISEEEDACIVEILSGASAS